MIEVMRPSAAVGDGKSGKATSATSPPDALRIVERLRRHVAKENRVEIAEVYS